MKKAAATETAAIVSIAPIVLQPIVSGMYLRAARWNINTIHTKQYQRDSVKPGKHAANTTHHQVHAGSDGRSVVLAP